MQTYELQSLPIISVAHIFSANAFSAKFNPTIDFIEVSHITEGESRFKYRGQPQIGKKGDIICAVRDSEPFFSEWDSFYEEHTVKAYVNWKALEDCTKGLYLPMRISQGPDTKVIESIIDQMIHDQLLFKDSPTRGATMFMNLLCEIDKVARASKELDIPGEILYTQRAKEFIQQNIHLPISQASIAEHLSISPGYLCKIFKKAEGCSIKRYINTEKLQSIKMLMKTEHLALYEAAAHFGYSDPNYVSRLFKKYYGYNITNKRNGDPETMKQLKEFGEVIK